MLDVILFGLFWFLIGAAVGALTLLAVQIWFDDNIRPSNPVARLRRDNDE